MNDAIGRALARDDLLTLAAAADQAVGIVRMREALARRTEDEKSLFDVALEHHLKCAETDHRWSVRSRAWDDAGIIVRFCELVKIKPDTAYTAEQLHANALRELEGEDRRDRDLAMGVFGRYNAARSLRLAGRYDEALSLVRQPIREFYGTGAEPYVGHYLYEQGVCFLRLGQAGQLLDELGEWDAYWEEGRQAGYSTRYRFDFIQALALLSSGAKQAALDQLALALERARQGQAAVRPRLPAHQSPEPEASEDDRALHELTVALTRADCLASLADAPEDRELAVELTARALSITDSVRGRWRVIARSRAPLAVVFQRIYGDIASLAARLHGPRAAEIGLRVALSAKQTGFAARLRTSMTLMHPAIGGIIEDIVKLDNDPPDGLVHDDKQREARLRKLNFDLCEAVSPMLADTVLPAPADLAVVFNAIAERHALDFVELPNTLDDRLLHFRTLIRPNRTLLFERFEPDTVLPGDFDGARPADRAARGLTRDVRLDDLGGGPRELDRFALAQAVLPEELLRDLRRRDQSSPIHLLISAHSWLSLLPWAALTIDTAGTRLVQRALITQCPVLTCLSSPYPPRVEGQALIRLVGKDEKGGVNIALEREAWDLGRSTDGVAVSQCALAHGVPEALPDKRLAAALQKQTAARQWQFLHIASHGAGKGEQLGQILDIPGEPLSAARALGLHWPTSVLMASCHVGQVINTKDSEPLNFVMALMMGGARCIVAGIDSVDDDGTGMAASRMVRHIRRQGLPLDVALRKAQLAAIAEGLPEVGWARLSAYVH